MCGWASCRRAVFMLVSQIPSWRNVTLSDVQLNSSRKLSNH